MGNHEVLTTWKIELQARKEELLKKQAILEDRLSKYQQRYNIACSIADVHKAEITKELETKVKQYQKELDDFITSNGAELREIEALIEKIG